MQSLGKTGLFVLPIVVLFLVLMLIAAPKKMSTVTLHSSYSGTLTNKNNSNFPPDLNTFIPASKRISLSHVGNTSYHWIRFEVPELANIDDPIFVLNPHVTSEFKLFLNDDFSKPISYQTRYDVLDDAIYTNQNKVVDLEPFKDASHFYLLVEEIRNITIDISVWNESNYLSYDLHVNSFFSAVIFGLFLMLIINSFFYITNKNKSYLYYLLYHSSILILILNITGFIFHYPALSVFSETLARQLCFLALSCFFLASFVRSFLNTKQYTPKLDKAIYVLQFVSAISLLALLIFPNLATSIVHLLNLVALVGIPLYSIIMVLHLRLGNRQAIFFTAAFSLVLFATIFRILYVWDILPQNFFTEYGAIIAIFIEAIIFSIGLADSVVELQRQRDSAKMQSKETTFIYNLEKDFNNLSSLINSHVYQSDDTEHRQFILEHFYNEFKDSLGIVSNGVIYKNANGIQQILDSRIQSGSYYQIIEANLKQIERVAKSGHSKKLIGKNAEFLVYPIPVRQHEWSVAILELKQNHVHAKYQKIFIHKYSRELLRSLLNADSIADIKNKADLDELTQVYNRGAIEAFIQHELDETYNPNNPLTIAFIDFDDFKLINDIHGHQAGDLCLKHLVKTFKDSLPSDYQIGRFGGDEFIIVLPRTNPFKALKLVNQAKNKITAVNYKNNSISFTISIGLASQASKDMTLSEILDAADKSLYESKGGGKNIISVA